MKTRLKFLTKALCVLFFLLFHFSLLAKSLEDQLIEAIEEEDLRSVQSLIKQDVNVNAKNKEGWTAFMMASFLGHTQIVKALLGVSSIDVNEGNKQGETALMYLPFVPLTETVTLLLKYSDLDVNKQDDLGWTALHWATFLRNKEFVEALLKHPKLDLAKENKDGGTAISLAKELEHKEIEELIFKHIDTKTVKNIQSSIDNSQSQIKDCYASVVGE